jgi:hypothetical protein
MASSSVSRVPKDAKDVGSALVVFACERVHKPRLSNDAKGVASARSTTSKTAGTAQRTDAHLQHSVPASAGRQRPGTRAATLLPSPAVKRAPTKVFLRTSTQAMSRSAGDGLSQ